MENKKLHNNKYVHASFGTTIGILHILLGTTGLVSTIAEFIPQIWIFTSKPIIFIGEWFGLWGTAPILSAWMYGIVFITIGVASFLVGSYRIRMISATFLSANLASYWVLYLRSDLRLGEFIVGDIGYTVLMGGGIVLFVSISDISKLFDTSGPETGSLERSQSNRMDESKKRAKEGPNGSAGGDHTAETASPDRRSKGQQRSPAQPSFEMSADGGPLATVNELRDTGDELRKEADNLRENQDYDPAIESYDEAQAAYEEALEVANKSELIDTAPIEQRLTDLEDEQQKIRDRHQQSETELQDNVTSSDRGQRHAGRSEEAPDRQRVNQEPGTAPAGVGGRQAELVSLSNGEQVLGNVTFFWWSWRDEIFGSILFFLLGVSVMVVGRDAIGSSAPFIGLVSILGSVVILLLVYRAKEKSGCLVTNKRIVLSKAGLLATETKEVRMAEIRSIVTARSGLQSVLGTGSVKVDTGAGELSIGARNASELAEVIRREKNRQHSD